MTFLFSVQNYSRNKTRIVAENPLNLICTLGFQNLKTVLENFSQLPAAFFCSCGDENRILSLHEMTSFLQGFNKYNDTKILLPWSR